ncbi:SycD/LcrH family type III secretion system chaperone [Chitinimonas lacunae]|uniref:SycD/LcrH family type III secretion system chaperone n=1 Tax=Chitinimonas lacunae TaxID=1963018 RepID=A0ABV8MRV1_9NEIS
MAAQAEFDFESFATELVDVFAHGGTLKDIHGYTDDECDALYTLGYNLYNQAKYGDALKIFGFLLQHDQLERRYYKAFASCLQMLKRPEEALKHYTMASLFDLTDPEPTFHTAECLASIGLIEEAREAIDVVLEQTQDKPQYLALNQRATAMRELLAGRS